jgi:hypothetical protein
MRASLLSDSAVFELGSGAKPWLVCGQPWWPWSTTCPGPTAVAIAGEPSCERSTSAAGRSVTQRDITSPVKKPTGVQNADSACKLASNKLASNPWRYIGARIALFGRGGISQELGRGLVIYFSGPQTGVVCEDHRLLKRAFERPHVWPCCRVGPLMRVTAPTVASARSFRLRHLRG